MFQPQLDPYLVGRVIARFRSEKGWTQEVLSGLAAIGRSHLSAIENGERKPTLETLYRISCALEVPMSDVVRAIEAELNQGQGGE
ncbi:MAG: helix-turn-helix transcriptional regulator [Flavonifractor sp.]|jgi:transcriptional regulator with XRE-family HTH domain|nr:helix-turn-helix transcriptional regulator [Flavonifractor sp.]